MVFAAVYAYCVAQDYAFQEDGIQATHTFRGNGIRCFMTKSPVIPYSKGRRNPPFSCSCGTKHSCSLG